MVRSIAVEEQERRDVHVRALVLQVEKRRVERGEPGGHALIVAGPRRLVTPDSVR